METKKSKIEEYVNELINRIKKHDDSWWSCEIKDIKSRTWKLNVKYRYGKYVIALYSKFYSSVYHEDIISHKFDIDVENNFNNDEFDVVAIRLLIMNKINTYKYY